MSIETALFYIFSAIMLVAAFKVITSKNPVHAALYLVLTFFQGALVWMLLRAEFLSVALVMVYVGAVMVLFLFVVMMLDINIEALRVGFWKHFPVAAGLGGLMGIEVTILSLGNFRQTTVAASADVGAAAIPNTKQIGMVLFTDYFYALEVAAAILLVAMIAAIALTLRTRKDSKYADPAKQVQARQRDRLKLVSMTATAKAPEVSADKNSEGNKQ